MKHILVGSHESKATVERAVFNNLKFRYFICLLNYLVEILFVEFVCKNVQYHILSFQCVNT